MENVTRAEIRLGLHIPLFLVELKGIPWAMMAMMEKLGFVSYQSWQKRKKIKRGAC